MKINHNDSAIITNVKLLRNENALTAAMERLSTGFKINHAMDSPSGMAISNKMQAQINALDQASRNSSDGMSVLETADGALQELTSILQRIRELAVQAANDTNSNSDRDAIQTEINELTSEVDRISEATEFNTKSLLNGSLDTHAYGDNMSRKYVSESVGAGNYKLSIDTEATQAEININVAGFTYPIPADQANSFKINGSIVTISEGMSEDEVDEAITLGCERGDVIAEHDTNGKLTGVLKTVDYGINASIEISTSAQGAAVLNIAENAADNYNATNPGKDAEITLDMTSAFIDHPNANVKQLDNRIIITDVNGFEISFKAVDGFTGDLDLEVTDLGPMDIQVGANAYQQLPVRIPSVSVDDMYLDKLNVRTHTTASKAIGSLDRAISYINTARAKIGSYTNRLEHTVANTDTAEENMTSAISRIMDADMAEEMTEYTKQNVLVQAATSALSQANEIPQMALQLLS